MNADLLERSAEGELASDDADRADDAHALGDDPVRGGGQVITAARSHGSDRNDERLFGTERHQLLPEQIRGEGRAPRRVDAKDDRLHHRILGESREQTPEIALDDRAAAEGRAAAHRDSADGTHQGDVRFPRMRRSAHRSKRIDEPPRHTASAFRSTESSDGAFDRSKVFGVMARIVSVAYRVDDSSGLGLFWRERAVLEGFDRHRGTPLPQTREPSIANAAKRTLEGRTCLRTRRLAREGLLCALELADLEKVDVDREPREQLLAE